MKKYISLDVGGSNINYALYDEKGDKLYNSKKKTKAINGKDFVIDRICEIIDELMEKGKKNIEGICISIPGIIEDNATIVFCPNIPFYNINLKQIVEKKFKVPTLIENDVNAAMWGEWRNTSKHYNNGIGLFVGTGVGGAIIINDKLYNGKGGAGEIGHMNVVKDGIMCGCGLQGCLESYVSKSGMMKIIELESKKEEKSLLYKFLKEDGSVIKSSSILKAYEKGDKLAKNLVYRSAEYLGSAIGTLVNIFNPDLFILGGGVMESIGEYMFDDILYHAKESAMSSLRDDIKIVSTKLGDDAGIKGGYYLIKEYLGDKHA